jgi:hypothetical protein
MSVPAFNTVVGRDDTAGAFVPPYPPWTNVVLPQTFTVATALVVAESVAAVVSPPGGWLAVDFSGMRIVRASLAIFAARVRRAGVEVGCGTDHGLDRYKPVVLPASKVDPGLKASVVLKPWREAVGSVLEFSSPQDKIKIMRVLDVAKAGLEHLMDDYIKYHGEDTDDMGPPLRWWFQFALGKNVVMAPPDAAANTSPGECWITLMDPFSKFEAKEREAALSRAAADAVAATAAAVAAARIAAAAADAATARMREREQRDRGEKRGAHNDKDHSGAAKHHKGDDKAGGKTAAAVGKQPVKASPTLRVDPYCVQHPGTKMTADMCPIHGTGHKRAECNVLLKPGLVELKDDPLAEKWKAYAAANKFNIVPAIGSSFKDANP